MPPTRWLTTADREQLEYKQWKKERNEIDWEREEQNKADTGNWKRQWDQHKSTESRSSKFFIPMKVLLYTYRQKGF